MISDALDVVCDLTGMPWLKFPKEVELNSAALIDEGSKIDADEDFIPAEKTKSINP